MVITLRTHGLGIELSSVELVVGEVDGECEILGRVIVGVASGRWIVGLLPIHCEVLRLGDLEVWRSGCEMELRWKWISQRFPPRC